MILDTSIIKEKDLNRSNPIVQTKFKYKKNLDLLLFTNKEKAKTFLCPLCQGILYEPILVSLNNIKICCKNCYKKYLENQQNYCPNEVYDEKNESNQRQKELKIIKKNLDLLDMKCKNYEKGCNWFGKYSQFNGHISLCLKEEIHCFFNGCKATFLRENTEKHLKECKYRIMLCNKCGPYMLPPEGVRHCDICPKEEIQCPTRCGAIFERCKLEEHLKYKCPFHVIKCPFEQLGCKEEFMRKDFDIKMNLNNYKHILLLLRDYLDFKQRYFFDHNISNKNEMIVPRNKCSSNIKIKREKDNENENNKEKVEQKEKEEKMENKEKEENKENVNINKYENIVEKVSDMNNKEKEKQEIRKNKNKLFIVQKEVNEKNLKNQKINDININTDNNLSECSTESNTNINHNKLINQSSNNEKVNDYNINRQINKYDIIDIQDDERNSLTETFLNHKLINNKKEKKKRGRKRKIFKKINKEVDSIEEIISLDEKEKSEEESIKELIAIKKRNRNRDRIFRYKSKSLINKSLITKMLVSNNDEKDNSKIKKIIENSKININEINSNSLEENKCFFVFVDDNRIKNNIEGTYSIEFTILEDNEWLSFGLCDKMLVEENKFAIKGIENNGCYIISTDNMVWHCTDEKQRNKILYLDGSSIGSKNNVIECKYTPSEGKLVFFVNNKLFAELSNVKPIKSEFLTPCLICVKSCAVKTSVNFSK